MGVEPGSSVTGVGSGLRPIQKDNSEKANLKHGEFLQKHTKEVSGKYFTLMMHA